MTLELDELRPRSWRRPTLAACGLTAMLVAVALVSLEPESLRAKRVDVPPDVARCAADAECMLVDRIGCCPCRSGVSVVAFWGRAYVWESDPTEPARPIA